MKTFLFDSLNRFRRYSQELDTMAEIRKCLCGKAWLVFNNSGDKEVYIFKEDGSLIISINGSVTKGSWEYLSENKSVIISASNQEYMVHPAFLDNILFALQVDGTENYAFLIDQINKQNFAPQSLDDLHRYFREKEQKRIEEENRKREEQRLAELKLIEEENRKREEQRLAELKLIEEEQKKRAERERREKEQREEEQKNRLAEKIYKDEIIKSRLLCFLLNSFWFWLFVAYLFALLPACWSFCILFPDYLLLALICWFLVLMFCFVLCFFLVIFSFDFPLSLIFRCRLKKFIKNNRTYSTDMLYRLVKYHNATFTSFGIKKLSYNEFKKLILDQIPTNEIHYTTKDNRFLSLRLSGVQILSHLYYQDINLFIVKFDKDVTEIGERAFSKCYSLTSITIPPSVTEIGDYAFSGCKSLKSISIPQSVTKIGERAFSKCYSLTSITIPPSVTEIGEEAFYFCSSLTSITIPPSVKKIGDETFSGCASLTSITVSKDNKVYDSREDCNAIIHTESNTLISGCKNTIIPLSVKEIWRGAFSGCYNLTSITIPPSVTEIGDYAFYYCESLTSISIPQSVTKIGKDAFYKCSSLTKITIPPSVTQIGKEAFYFCSSLTSISIPPSVTEIGNLAFSGCASLTSISIPPSVTEIGNLAFSGCASLTSITVSKDNKVYDSREDCNAIIHTESNTLIRGCENTIIPPSVTKIGKDAFYKCSSLTNISIPPSVKKIGDVAFYGCSSLTSITIPPSVTEIGERVFSGCSSLTSISIPPSVTEIGVCAFDVCSSLTSITIPESVTKIRQGVFSCCSSLTSISIPSSVTEIWGGAFSDCSSLTEVRIPKGCYVDEDAFRNCPNVQIIRY